MNGRRHDIVPADRLSRSVTQQTESGSSNSAELSGRNSSPPPIARQLLARPTKRLRSSTIQTTAYTKPQMEADGQRHMEPVCLGDDSSDEYQMSHLGDETEPDTEPEGANRGGADETTPRRHHGLRLETHGNNRPRTMRISTNSGSQEAAIVPRTPAARLTITPSRPWSPATFPSSSVARYSSPLGVPSTTTSGIRSLSPPGEPSTRGTVSVRHVINSQRNTLTGVDGEILGIAKDLMLQYTLYLNPLPNLVALTSVVHSVWS